MRMVEYSENYLSLCFSYLIFTYKIFLSFDLDGNIESYLRCKSRNECTSFIDTIILKR